MAVSAIAGLVGAAGAAAAGITVFGLAATTLAGFAAAFALGAGMSIVSRALMPKPDMGAVMQGTTATVREPASSRKVIYGRSRVGGSVIFLANSGAKNEYLHLVIVYAGHEIDAYEKIYFNDKKIWENGSFVGAWGSYARINFYDGTQTSADPNLVSESIYWSSDHKVLGSAYIHVRLKWDREQFPQGVPNISAVIRGKKVYDPRTDTTAWSQNPALCLQDYFLDTRYGLGESPSRINSASLTAAANLCDELISLKDGGTQTRYSIDGVVDSASSIKENIESMLASMGGRVVFSGGQYFISGSAYTSPTINIDESAVVGDITVQTKQSRRSMYNGVKGVFLSEEKNYILADYPAQISSTYALDDGDPIYLDMTLPYVTNSVRAQRLAKIALLKSRQQTTVTIPLNLVGLKFKAGDFLTVSNTKMGWNEKPFEVLDYSIQPGNSGAIIVNLNCIETSADVYDWTTSDELDLFDEGELDLYDGRAVSPPTSLVVTETTVVAEDGTLVPSLRMNWVEPDDAFVERYEIQWQRADAITDYGSVGDEYTVSENWESITVSADLQLDYGSIDEATLTDEPNYNSAFTSTVQYIISGVIPNANYNIRLRAINNFGVSSTWVTSTSVAQGDTDAPAIPDSLTAVGGLREISLSWQPPTDPDYSHVEVWENEVNNFASAIKIAIASGDHYVRTGLGYNVNRYYWVKSVDYSGNLSDESSVASATTLFVDTDSFSEEVNNLFSEAGAYGIEPVSSLPATGDFDGQIKYDTTANKLYRWDAATSSWTDDIFSITTGSVDLASFASGIEPVGIVSSLPNPAGYTGAQVVFNTTDNKLYRYTGTSWVASIPAADIDGALALANFPTNLRPIEIVSSLPSTGNFEGRQVYLTTDNKLYRFDGTNWTAKINTVDLEGTITSLQIANDAVTNAKIAVDAIQGDVIAAGAITSAKILDGAISELKLANDAVTTAKLANAAVTADIVAANAITATNIQDGAISTPKLAAGSITTGKIAAGAVTATEIASLSITSAKIAAGAVTAAEIAAGSITTAKIAAGAVTAAEIAANTITASEIAAGAVTASEIAANAVTAVKIAADSITSEKITAGAITTAKIAADAITANEIAAAAVTADAISAGSVQAGAIAAGAISADKIAANAVTSDKITANAITSDKISANAITAGKIAAAAVSTTELSANAITADKIASNVITSDKIAANTIQGDRIAANTITGGLIAASGIITSAAQIDDAVVTNAKIQNLAANKLLISANTDGQASSIFLDDDGSIKVYDASGTLRVKIGNLAV